MIGPRVVPALEHMTAYTPPLEGRSDHGYLLLDFNERTIPLPEVVVAALADYVNKNNFHRYPEYGDICTDIAAYAGVQPEQTLITNGSDQGIDMVFRAFTLPGDEVIIPAPTFPIFPHSARLQGCRIVEPLYDLARGYPVTEVCQLASPRTKIIVICNPNNPTGTLVDQTTIARIAHAAPHSIILVDECYFEFSQMTAKDLLQSCPNIIISRTFSKTWGLAALRLGYLIATPSYVQEFLKVRGPYDVNRFAVEALRIALRHSDYVAQFAREVMDQSLPMFRDFLESLHIPYWPTGANFVLLKPPDAKRLELQLRERGIVTRPRSGPNIEGTLRITMGTVSQTERLIANMRDILATSV